VPWKCGRNLWWTREEAGKVSEWWSSMHWYPPGRGETEGDGWVPETVGWTWWRCLLSWSPNTSAEHTHLRCVPLLRVFLSLATAIVLRLPCPLRSSRNGGDAPSCPVRAPKGLALLLFSRNPYLWGP
jgi:hypothetical protein